MTVNPNSPVITYTTRLFARGVELYDRQAKKQINAGGAQIYQLIKWKTPNGPIGFNDEKFGEILRGIGATLHSLNRILLDSDGKPRHVPGTNSNSRTDSGLMLYMQYGEDGSTARDAASLITEAFPELKDNVAAVVDLLPTVPNLQELSKVQLAKAADYDPIQFMNPLKAVILAVSSGSRDSMQKWYYKTMTRTRAAIDESRKVTAAEVSDLI